MQNVVYTELNRIVKKRLGFFYWMVSVRERTRFVALNGHSDTVKTTGLHNKTPKPKFYKLNKFFLLVHCNYIYENRIRLIKLSSLYY